MCPPQMYGGMGHMGGMSFGAANFYDVDDDNNKKMKSSKKKRKTVDINLSQESTSNVSDNDSD